MPAADLILNPSWVIPVEPDNQVLTHHSVVIQEGKIAAIVPSNEAERAYAASQVVDLQGHALLPGFINAHTHAAMSLFRGLAVPLMQWLQQHIWPAEMKWVSDEFVRAGVELAVAEMLCSGTTCFADMYFYPEDAAHVLRDTHMRAVLGLIMLDFPSPYAQNSDEYLDKGIKLHDTLRNSELLSTMFAPHAPYTISDGPLNKIATLSEELDIGIQIHLHETAHEVDEAVAQNGMRPLARLNALGLLTPRLCAVHMTQLQDDEIALVRETGAHVIHCPESNLKLASGFCPVHQLREAGINVALGTDGAASNNDLDMLGEMRSAALLAKGVSQNATALPAHTALRMATLDGARALGLEHKIGSLKPGKAADLISIDLGHLNTHPVYDPVSQIVYAAHQGQVQNVWIGGRHLLDGGRLVYMDETRIMRHAQGWRDKIHIHDKT